MVNCTFDAEKHQYFIDDFGIPNVTGLLEGTGILKFGVGGTELENKQAMNRGRAVHAACEFLDQDDLNWATVQDDIIPYVLAYEKFKKETGFKPLRIEERLFHLSLRYGGTLDREGKWRLGEAHVLLDLKTGVVSPWTALQLAGYDLLLPSLKLPRERYGLQLKPDGNYSLTQFKDRQDKDLFLSIVALHWWKENHNI